MTFTQEEVESAIREGISAVMEGAVQPDEIMPGMTLFEPSEQTLDMDSLQLLDLALYLEERFQTELPHDIEMTDLITVADLYNVANRMISLSLGHGERIG